MPEDDENPFDEERTYVADDSTKSVSAHKPARPQAAAKLNRRPARSLDLEPDERIPTGPADMEEDLEDPLAQAPAPLLPWVLFGVVTLLFLVTTVLLSLRLSSERDRAAFELKARLAETEKVNVASSRLAELTSRADKAEADLNAAKLEVEALKAEAAKAVPVVAPPPPVPVAKKVPTPVTKKPVAKKPPAKKGPAKKKKR